MRRHNLYELSIEQEPLENVFQSRVSLAWTRRLYSTAYWFNIVKVLSFYGPLKLRNSPQQISRSSRGQGNDIELWQSSSLVYCSVPDQLTLTQDQQKGSTARLVSVEAWRWQRYTDHWKGSPGDGICFREIEGLKLFHKKKVQVALNNTVLS
jgi:hypothetical protein